MSLKYIEKFSNRKGDKWQIECLRKNIHQAISVPNAFIAKLFLLDSENFREFSSFYFLGGKDAI
jgi:hypothetical protein